MCSLTWRGIMFLRNLLNVILNITIVPLGITIYILLEALRQAKQIEIKIDQIKKGKK